MKISIISVTEQGRALSEKLASLLGEEFETERYCFKKHSDDNSNKFTKIGWITSRLFPQTDALVFVCSCGIAVRTIAPLVSSKAADPAVVVVDDAGKFSIPILSGHFGGANGLSEIIAQKIGAAAVITTATDIRGRFSPDSFARANRLLLSDFSAAKEIAAAVLNDEKIGLVCDFPYKNLPFEIVEMKEKKASQPLCRTGICISADPLRKPFEVTLNLIPKNFVLGIGCKKNTTCAEIEKHVFLTMQKEGINGRRVCAVASIDIKAKEPGLVEFCEKFNLPFKTFSAAELMEARGEFSSSKFVLAKTGADNVCERSAVRYGGSLILKKRSSDNVTAAVAEIPFEVDFERKFP